MDIFGKPRPPERPLGGNSSCQVLPFKGLSPEVVSSCLVRDDAVPQPRLTIWGETDTKGFHNNYILAQRTHIHEMLRPANRIDAAQATRIALTTLKAANYYLKYSI
ncbi:hypothetical protein LSM04_007206 [Trypanosoma melophagium]|uniref:uncharacterized protein n=1 Tax=Trypanosoma melophagium TaxID=715481 RepID=UPI00351AAC56|nr:hypothetical protein LSM04_007206 [Trypanosoma melophagium]